MRPTALDRASQTNRIVIRGRHNGTRGMRATSFVVSLRIRELCLRARENGTLAQFNANSRRTIEKLLIASQGVACVECKKIGHARKVKVGQVRVPAYFAAENAVSSK